MPGGAPRLKKFCGLPMTQKPRPVGPSFPEDDDGVFTEDRETVKACDEDSGLRLDVFLALKLGITRSSSKKLIDGGNVSLLSGVKPKASLKIAPGMTLEVAAPCAWSPEPEPEDVPFDVVWEDEKLLVVNKPAGLVVHPAPGNWRGTLVHGLLYRYPSLAGVGDVQRPGIVHRLDGPTSGLMVVAKDRETMEQLQEQFRQRSVIKIYLALVRGRIKNCLGSIGAPIGRSPANRLRMAVVDGGREALTNYKRLWTKNGFSFIECEIPTGRTHQIRVHMAAIGRPIVGDSLYGPAGGEVLTGGRIFLHSWKLSFTHPQSAVQLSFTCCLPAELTGRLREILSTGRD